jgi:uracil-DNA glycosylase
MNLEDVGEGWGPVLEGLRNDPMWRSLDELVEKDRREHVVYPPANCVFRAMKETPLREVKVVILGQDPYHRLGQAEGLAFSVAKGVQKPPSLANILKELASDTGCTAPISGSLLSWAHQGVLLLNSVLTVRENAPGSHAKIGWETVTDRLIAAVNDNAPPTVFVLWGAYAQTKGHLVNRSKHCVLESVHPSPLSASRGFFGSKPFSQANRFLESAGRDQINWRLHES